MRTLVFVIVAALLGAGSAGAQGVTAGRLDHLVCYKMKDDLKIRAQVDLKAELQPEFSQAGCVVVKPTKFCVPTTKSLLQPVSTGLDIVGQPLRNDFICYQLKCPRDGFPAIPAKLVGDQFGRHRQGKYQAVELCVPARKEAVPCGRVGTGKQCGGACPADGNGQSAACRFDKDSGECTCAPEPTCGGRPDAAGQCGGICAQAGEVCRPGLDAAGKLSCACQPPATPQCGPNFAAGMCGGACPNPMEQCVNIASPAAIECSCQPRGPGCQREPGTSQCGGDCPAGFKCSLDPVIDDCRCTQQPQPCGNNPFTGECSGFCEEGGVCRAFNDGPSWGCMCTFDLN
ncbi:MAG: hypothetical protein OZ922_11545 [Myxococcales bacterium]|nr:hypothetical protein [Myxococcales bacterium]